MSEPNCITILKFHSSSKKSEEDFYSSLAAQADDMSDVSEADPDEMAKSLAVRTVLTFEQISTLNLKWVTT